MGDVHGAFSIRREYAYAIGARHLELLLDSILLRRRRWCLPPQVPHVTSPRIAFACYSLSRTLPYSRRMFSIACHSFYRIQIPIHRPQEPFLVHATVSPYSFHFFNAFRECERAFIFSFFGPTQQEISAERRNKRFVSNFFFLRDRDFLILLWAMKNFQKLTPKKVGIS
jgi:hypothetical protein